MAKNYALYVHHGVNLLKIGPVSPWDLSRIEKTQSNFVVLSTDCSSMVFPQRISLKSNEVFDFRIEIKKVDPKFWPESSSEEKNEKITAGAWECP
jgi:hypothetical protein